MAELVAAMVLALICVAIIVAGLSGVWKAFAKAGKPGWTGIVPFYNNIVMAELADKPAWWGCLCWIPYLGVIPYIVLCSAIAKKFGKGIEMTILMIVGIGWIILGWGNAQYDDDLAVAKNLEKPKRKTRAQKFEKKLEAILTDAQKKKLAEIHAQRQLAQEMAYPESSTNVQSHSDNPGTTTCVWCLEEVKIGARVCKHCGNNPSEESPELCSRCGKHMFKTPRGKWVCEKC